MHLENCSVSQNWSGLFPLQILATIRTSSTKTYSLSDTRFLLACSSRAHLSNHHPYVDVMTLQLPSNLHSPLGKPLQRNVTMGHCTRPVFSPCQSKEHWRPKTDLVESRSFSSFSFLNVVVEHGQVCHKNELFFQSFILQGICQGGHIVRRQCIRMACPVLSLFTHLPTPPPSNQLPG